MLPGVESVGEVADAVLVSVVPLATFAPTLKIRVNVADAFEARVAMLQLTEPAAPTLGFVQSNAGPACASVPTETVAGWDCSARGATTTFRIATTVAVAATRTAETRN